MRHPVRSALALLLLVPVVAVLAGCGKSGSSVSPASTGTVGSLDQTQVSLELSQHPEVLDDDGLSTAATQGSTTSGSTTGTASLEAAIRPLFFWRHITSSQRSFEFAFADTDSTGRPTRATVTVLRRLAGDFDIVVGDSSSLGSGSVVKKPLVDHWVRRIELRRVRLTAGGDPVWRIVAASAVRVTSDNATAHIASVRVQAAGLDTTLTDPLQLFRLRQVLMFAPGTPVTLTVTTTHTNDVVLLYAADRRMRFHDNADGTYTGTWTVPDVAGLRHVGVNALTHGTLYDDTAPYDSQAWMMPYVVTGQGLGDMLTP